MTILNAEHLLDQAVRLIASPQPGPPRQVDIRRSISAAYYGLFHAILTAAADSVASRAQRGSATYALAYRSIDHRTLRSVCEMVRRPALPLDYRAHVPAEGFDPSIKRFAETALSGC